jgi:hypothetical protein
MASQLSVIEKKQLLEHKIALQEDGIAFTYKDQVASDVEFMFNKKITVPLSKMMISRFRQRVQGTLDSFLR